MPLASECKAVLDWVASANLPSYPSVGAVEARKLFRMGRMALQNPPPDVASVQNRAIPGPRGEIPVRIYRPLGSNPTAAYPKPSPR